jgi:aryl-alcohol dehydrogenase-like predicted oxidoreductase
MGDGPNDQGLSRYHIIQSVEDSLRRLQTDTIDILYAHCWDSITPLEETLRTFDELVRSGKVRYIGVSNYKAWQLMKALTVSEAHGWAKFVAAQYQYSLVERNIEQEISELCLNEGLGLTPWGPLGGGFLSGKYQQGGKPAKGRLSMMPDDTEEAWHRRAIEQNWAILQAVDEIANDHQASHSQIALAWLIQQPAVSSVIMGVRTMTQLEDNLASSQVSLTRDELERLNLVSKLEDRYPYRFIDLYGTRNPKEIS